MSRSKGFSAVHWIFVGAGLLYLLNVQRTFVGCFGDDARDLLAATSLLHGQYASLQNADRPPLNFPLPGFPLLLAPFAALLSPHWAMIKIIPIASALASGAFLWSLLGHVVARRIRLILLALFLFNPTTLFLSGLVIADTFFVCLVLAVFWRLNLLLKDPHSRHGWGIGGLLAWAALTRPEGILLVLAVSGSLFYFKRSRQSLHALAPTVLAGSFWLGRNLHVTGHLSGYGSLWQTSLKALSQTSLLLRHWIQMTASWFWEVLAGITFSHALPWWAALAAAAAGILGVWGFLAWYQENKTARGLALAVGIFVGLFIALHAVWLAVHPHYFFPLLPFSLLFFAKALEKGERHWAPILKAGILAVALTGSVYAVQTYHQVFSAEGVSPENRFPSATLAWIKTHIPPDRQHQLLAARAPTATLYTGCYSLAFIPAHDADQFRFKVLAHGISHILVEPVPILFVATTASRDPQTNWSRIEEWVRQSPRAFRAVFQNSQERTTIYEVTPNSAGDKIYQHYQSALRLFASSQVPEGIAEADEAWRIFQELKRKETGGRS